MQIHFKFICKSYYTRLFIYAPSVRAFFTIQFHVPTQVCGLYFSFPLLLHHSHTSPASSSANISSGCWNAQYISNPVSFHFEPSQSASMSIKSSKHSCCSNVIRSLKYAASRPSICVPSHPSASSNSPVNAPLLYVLFITKYSASILYRHSVLSVSGLLQSHCVSLIKCPTSQKKSTFILPSVLIFPVLHTRLFLSFAVSSPMLSNSGVALSLYTPK